MKLSKTQLDYAANRIKQIIRDKHKADKEALIQPETLTAAGKWALVLKGKIKMREGVSLDHRDYIRLSDFVFPEDKTVAAYNKAEAALCIKWAAIQQQALDKLHLAGDADAALALINSL